MLLVKRLVEGLDELPLDPAQVALKYRNVTQLASRETLEKLLERHSKGHWALLQAVLVEPAAQEVLLPFVKKRSVA